MSRWDAQIASKYEEMRQAGLPEEWVCTVDEEAQKLVWKYETTTCHSIKEALQVSLTLGLFQRRRRRTNTTTTTNTTTVHPPTKQQDKQQKQQQEQKKPAPSPTKKKRSRSKTGRPVGRPPKYPKQPKQPSTRPVGRPPKSAALSTAHTKSQNKKPPTNESPSDDTKSVASSIASTPPAAASASSLSSSNKNALPLDPERTFDPTKIIVARSKQSSSTVWPSTLYWDFQGRDGQLIGQHVKLRASQQNNDKHYTGRIVQFDPFTHQHKIVLDKNKNGGDSFWLYLRNLHHNLFVSQRLIWGHVKGYAWWPARILMSTDTVTHAHAHLDVEFFGTAEASKLRPETMRPFHHDTIDPVVAKHRKKRNAAAYQAALRELQEIQTVRNAAVLQYAQTALRYIQQLHPLVGHSIRFFRDDVNYPYGQTVVGRVRQVVDKQYLVTFDNGKNTPPTWLPLQKGRHKVKILDDNNNDNQDNFRYEVLLPFVFGYENPTSNKEDDDNGNDSMAQLLESCCKNCAQPIVGQQRTRPVVTCQVCHGHFHWQCTQPDLPRSMPVDSFVCRRCTPCRGCFQKDLCYGVSSNCPIPASCRVQRGLDLCSVCKIHYEKERFCPNCGHTWDDKKRRFVQDSLKVKPKHKSIVDDYAKLDFGTFLGDDEKVPQFDEKVLDPAIFYPETSVWGYTEGDMMVCDSCRLWVHAGCAGVDQATYEVITEGDHPIYSKEFLCYKCCRGRVKELIAALQQQDRRGLFLVPVSEKVVPNYHDIIKRPMDLQTMTEMAERDEYLNYAWVRDMFELIVFNALTFNRYYTDVWVETKRFYEDSLANVFAKIGKAAPKGKYHKDIQECFKTAEQARKNEAERVQVDESVEKKDLVAGSMASMLSVSVGSLRDAPPDQSSCVPCREVRMKPFDAFYCSWMDACFTCGSSGASDTFLFCVDCGEAFHSFCVSAPIHSMEKASVAGWRCPNCKIDEISGDVPADERRMLYCEMCDRGFSLDLLDPPLSSAPSGLWVCGQCVDCKKCGNTAEEEGASLRYWSQDPEKCYRCGGCDEASGEFDAVGSCQICHLLLRSSDENAVSCSNCPAYVHTKCDPRAAEHFDKEETSRSQKLLKTSPYTCPSCYRPTVQAKDREVIEKERMLLSHIAWKSIVDRSVQLVEYEPGSETELYQKLVDEMDWEVRRQWTQEYVSIIRDAIRVYWTAKSQIGDPRFVIQQVLQRMHQLPVWLGQRALRFAGLVKLRRWDYEGFQNDNIYVVVPVAKLASAFIDVACRTMGINKEKDVACFVRMTSLLKEHCDSGEVALPLDRMKECSDVISIAEDGKLWIEPKNVDMGKATKQRLATTPISKTSQREYIVASPLCGWGEEVKSSEGMSEWRDPRECCLCHFCGDDDAGLATPPVNVPGKKFPSLGRLLPLSDGYWVHASCALWSSEVWEAPDDGLVHAVEKARGRGAQLKCFGCGYPGATVGCSKTNCPFNYHFPCAKRCGAVFMANQHVFCSAHAASGNETLDKVSFEHMKALIAAPEKSEKEGSDTLDPDVCTRLGAVTVHCLGQIETNSDGFHSENHVTPPGYVATRIFWSAIKPRHRTVYILKVEKDPEGKPLFSITPGDDPPSKIVAPTIAQSYGLLIDKVKRVNADHFSQGDMLSKLPAVRRSRRKAFGLNAAQFFGFGLDSIRRLLECCPGVEAATAPLTLKSPRYRFCFSYGPESDATKLEDLIRDLQRKRAAVKAEEELQNSTGCARTEGIKAVVKSGGSGRITRALVRSAEDYADAAVATNKKTEEKAKADRNIVQVKYRRMKSIPMEQRLVARRSHIHGWGLFTKMEIAKHDPVVEYMGEVIHQHVADIREKAYELSGEGSCYMFRLDRQRIVDATTIGSFARFMNHSCQPNAYAKVISVDTDLGQDRKIVVFALRDISVGEEITYDYKFPVEDGSIRCSCGAPNCIGRLN